MPSVIIKSERYGFRLSFEQEVSEGFARIDLIPKNLISNLDTCLALETRKCNNNHKRPGNELHSCQLVEIFSAFSGGHLQLCRSTPREIGVVPCKAVGKLRVTTSFGELSKFD